MDTLIIGGLLVIGVGALVALFFVLRGGDTAQAKTPAAVPQTAREAPPTLAEPEPQPEQPENVTPSTPEATTVSKTRTAPLEVTPISEARTVPVAETIVQDGVTTAHPMYEKEQPLRVHLNGQFHELTQGLRSLQQQATEMEQRLSSLNQMLEGIERNQPEEK